MVDVTISGLSLEITLLNFAKGDLLSNQFHYLIKLTYDFSIFATFVADETSRSSQRGFNSQDRRGILFEIRLSKVAEQI